MGIIIGPTTWWANELAAACPVGTALPDGSRTFCKVGGRAWIVAPSSTQVGSAWAGGQYNSTLVGDKCCISEWSGLCTQLIACGFNPCDWFVPNMSQLISGYCCRTNWDTFTNSNYWASTETTAADRACRINFGTCEQSNCLKSNLLCTRAIRCVTY